MQQLLVTTRLNVLQNPYYDFCFTPSDFALSRGVVEDMYGMTSASSYGMILLEKIWELFCDWNQRQCKCMKCDE